MFSGLSGLGFAATCAARGGDRYQRLLRSVDAYVLPAALRLARAVADAGRSTVETGRFDTISGLSGVGAYLLSRIDDPTCADALTQVLGALATLPATGPETPRWAAP